MVEAQHDKRQGVITTIREKGTTTTTVKQNSEQNFRPVGISGETKNNFHSADS
jgi:hypothetical protein